MKNDRWWENDYQIKQICSFSSYPSLLSNCWNNISSWQKKINRKKKFEKKKIIKKCNSIVWILQKIHNGTLIVSKVEWVLWYFIFHIVQIHSTITILSNCAKMPIKLEIEGGTIVQAWVQWPKSKMPLTKNENLAILKIRWYDTY